MVAVLSNEAYQRSALQGTRQVKFSASSIYPFVNRNLRLRAERARAIDASIGCVRRDDVFGRLAVLDPRVQRANHVERVRSVAAAAVAHSETMNSRIHWDVLSASAARPSTLL